MNILGMIKAQSKKDNKTLLREVYTNLLTIIRVLGSMVIAVILTYQLKFFFEQLYVTSYPINHFMTAYAILFVFTVLTFTIMKLLKYIMKIGVKLRLGNK